MKTWEAVVIGAGPGGAVTARALAEAGREVLWLEEGPHLSLDACAPFSRAELEQKYRCGGLTVALGRPKIQYVEGRCVGGGSEINSGLYHRLPETRRQVWARTLPDFTAADLVPHFEYIEQELSIAYSEGPPSPPAQKLVEGAAALGLTAQAIPRWFRGDRKQSMTETFVPKALAAGAVLWAECRVQRVRRTSEGWLLSLQKSGQPQTVQAANVFVCGGAIQTPALLQRSGVRGPTGLQMHPTVRAIAVFPEPVNHPGLGVSPYQVQASERYRFGSSAATPGYVRLGLLDYPGVEVPWAHTAMYYVALAGGERGGSVRAIPGFADPFVGYALTDRDRRELAQGLGQLCRLLLAAGATAIYPSLAGCPPIQALPDVETLPAILPGDRARLMTVHVFGSCPLGQVVDPWGQVAPGLYVNDASLLPGALGVNPQGTVMALARRNVQHFLGRG